MIIYYNPAYSASPYRKNENCIEFGNAYCGNTQLLQRLLFYAGLPYLPASNEGRIAHYHAAMQSKVDASSPFFQSFKTDSAGMSRTIIAWRDALVEVGWPVKSYAGNSIKLSLLRDIEPENMPQGESDYWRTLLQIASAGRILPDDIQIVITCCKQEIKPHIAHILAKQQEFGVSVEYRTEKKTFAYGNLGKLQEAILTESKEKISLDKAMIHFVIYRSSMRMTRYVMLPQSPSMRLPYISVQSQSALTTPCAC